MKATIADLVAGQKIFVRLRGENRTFPADVLEVSPRSVTISPPTFRETPLALKFGDEVTGVYAAQGVRFVFSARVLAAPAGGRCVLGPLHEPLPLQERANVRYAVRLKVELTEEGGGPCSATTLNLSSGGLQVVALRAFPEGSPLRVKLILPGELPLPIEAAAQVIWAEKVLEEGRWLFRLGLGFVRPAIWQQDEIFRFIFRRMVEDRQRREGGGR